MQGEALADKKHPNDDYVNPGPRTASAPLPPEIHPAALREQLAAERKPDKRSK